MVPPLGTLEADDTKPWPISPITSGTKSALNVPTDHDYAIVLEPATTLAAGNNDVASLEDENMDILDTLDSYDIDMDDFHMDISFQDFIDYATDQTTSVLQIPGTLAEEESRKNGAHDAPGFSGDFALDFLSAASSLPDLDFSSSTTPSSSPSSFSSSPPPSSVPTKLHCFCSVTSSQTLVYSTPKPAHGQSTSTCASATLASGACPACLAHRQQINVPQKPVYAERDNTLDFLDQSEDQYLEDDIDHVMLKEIKLSLILDAAQCHADGKDSSDDVFAQTNCHKNSLECLRLHKDSHISAAHSENRLDLPSEEYMNLEDYIEQDFDSVQTPTSNFNAHSNCSKCGKALSKTRNVQEHTAADSQGACRCDLRSDVGDIVRTPDAVLSSIQIHDLHPPPHSPDTLSPAPSPSSPSMSPSVFDSLALVEGKGPLALLDLFSNDIVPVGFVHADSDFGPRFT